MTIVAVLAFGTLGAAALLCLTRLALGPTLPDRIVASETLLAVVVAGLGGYVAVERDTTVLPLLVVVSLLGFVGAVSVARYVGGMLSQRSADRPGRQP